jgi:hypothetical protein
MEHPFNIPQFKVSCHLMFIISNLKSKNSVEFEISFSSVKCSNPLVCKESVHKGFTALMNVVRNQKNGCRNLKQLNFF